MPRMYRNVSIEPTQRNIYSIFWKPDLQQELKDFRLSKNDATSLKSTELKSQVEVVAG